MGPPAPSRLHLQGEKMKKVLVAFTLSLSFIVVGLTTALIGTNTNVSVPYKINYNALSLEAKQEVRCLAENIYFESAHEPKEGKIAVAFVTINRVRSGLFENNICGVVKQKTNGTCQFSWWCEERPKSISTTNGLTNGDNKIYNEILRLATYVYANHELMEDPSKGALFYHADYVKPGWKNMEHLTTIGRHIFYARKDIKNWNT